ncbi:hypothetical protein B0H13DRAFT_1876323 [Mycena leptocephala]|nr:hypothetical protein B0H13DRAFT_1876323 [Mycena leptocephala]
MVAANLLVLPFFLAASSDFELGLCQIRRMHELQRKRRDYSPVLDPTDIESPQPDACNTAYIQNAATCFTCQVEAGGLTQEEAQRQLNGTASTCGLIGKPVDPVTIPFNGSTSTGTTSTGTGSGSAPSNTAPSPPAGSSPAAGKTGSALSVNCGSSGAVASVLVILSFAAMFV